MSEIDVTSFVGKDGVQHLPGLRDDGRPILVREVPLEIADGDGRTLEARIIPYGESATICDPPDYEMQQERFAPGAFDRQINAAHRVKVWLSTMHEQGLRGIVGHGEKLEDREDGVYATFRVHENPDGDKALQMVRDGLLPAMSVEFVDLQSVKRAGFVERVRAHLERVSLVQVGAYRGAEVLALREPPIELPRIPALADELAQSLSARGFKLGDETSDDSE
jgi:HK97 family phage prohead protease